jgi:hypothetical protein
VTVFEQKNNTSLCHIFALSLIWSHICTHSPGLGQSAGSVPQPGFLLTGLAPYTWEQNPLDDACPMAQEVIDWCLLFGKLKMLDFALVPCLISFILIFGIFFVHCA